MTEEEALRATEAFARGIARRGVEEIRKEASGMELRKGSNPAGYFRAIHGGLAAAFALGYDIGRAAGRAEAMRDDR